jgi:hypothetical protein
MVLSKLAKAVIAVLVSAPIATASAVALSGPNHAALAYSDARHVYGFANQQATKAAAEAQALQFCGQGCTIRLSWESGCGAYAQGDKNIHYGWAVAPTMAAAQQTAIAACTKLGGTNCTLRESGCE